MRMPRYVLPCLSTLLLIGCATAPANDVPPPRAPEMPRALELHGHVRHDEYYGLRERENPRVLAYLRAENEYTAAMMAHTTALQEELFAELKGRVKQTDASAPYREGGYHYYTRYEEGSEYAIHSRRPGSLEAAEEVLLDENALAAEHTGYFAVGMRRVSPGGALLAYAVDTVGRRFYTVFFKDLETGELLADRIPNATGNLAWANDDPYFTPCRIR